MMTHFHRCQWLSRGKEFTIIVIISHIRGAMPYTALLMSMIAKTLQITQLSIAWKDRWISDSEALFRTFERGV